MMIFYIFSLTAAATAGMYFYYRKSKRQKFSLDSYLTQQTYIANNDTLTRTSVLEISVPTAFTEVSVVYELFQCGYKSSYNLACFGSRPNQNCDYTWITYDEVFKIIRSLVLALDLLVFEKHEIGCTLVGILSQNSPQWLMVELACSYVGLTIVPLYETLGNEAVHHILKEMRIELVFCDSLTTANRLSQILGTNLRYIIVMNNIESSDLYVENQMIKIFSLDKFMQSNPIFGCETLLQKPRSKPDDLFMICHTSGSTGLPKGVKITHTNFISTVKSLYPRIEGDYFNTNSVHFSYLPLAHVMEQLISLTTLMCGGRIGFLANDIRGFLLDVQAIKPTYFFTVPRVLSKLHSTVYAKLSTHPILYRVFNYAIECKLAQQKCGRYNNSSIWDKLFFEKIRKLLGGQVRVIVCGSAPLPREILHFTRAAFSCPVLTAYGLTESCGVVSITYFGDTTADHVGALVPGITVKLKDVPSMDLDVSKTGIGEICVKGPHCTSGYFNNEELTKEIIDSNGWLHTGDIGYWTNEGALKIVDRCKNMFKLAQGEYIAPEKLEIIYQLSPFIEQAFVDGNSLQNLPVAIIIPNFEELTKYLSVHSDEFKSSSHKISSHSSASDNHFNSQSMDYAKFCSNHLVRKLIVNEIEKFGRKEGLKGFELVKSVHLSPVPFTIQNNLLTPNLKLARLKLRHTFANVIHQLYEENCN